MLPFLSGLAQPLSIAHRGGATLAPENTLYAFSQAIERYGAQMIETDLQGSQEGELVVFHDERLERCTDGRGKVRDHRLSELQALDAGYHFAGEAGGHPFRGKGLRIPTLRELLEAFPTTPLHLDLKDGREGLEQELARLLRGQAHRICVGSADDRVALRLRERLPDFALFAPKRALIRWLLAVRLGLRPQPMPWQVLSLPWRHWGHRVVNASLLRRAAQEGKWVNAWTVDEPEEMRRLIDLGIGGIMSDRPDRLQAQLAARG